MNLVAADVDTDNVLHHKRDRRPRTPLPISTPPPPCPLVTSPMQRHRKDAHPLDPSVPLVAKQY